MNFVSVRDLRGKSAKIWQELSRKKEIVITSNGKPIAVLSSVNQDNLEVSLKTIRRARALAALDHMQQQSFRSKTDRISRTEINKEIASVRKTRKK